jgi:hypothetical protein
MQAKAARIPCISQAAALRSIRVGLALKTTARPGVLFTVRAVKNPHCSAAAEHLC